MNFDRLKAPCLLAAAAMMLPSSAFGQANAVSEVQAAKANVKAGETDSPMMAISSLRNSVSNQTVPVEFDVAGGDNIVWTADLGSDTYGNPVIANGKVFVGTNNENGYLERLPSEIDLGVLACFDEKDGSFLWQHSSQKLEQGRYFDWPQQGICSTPFVDGDRLWFVNNRGEVLCLDTEGFLDGENDGIKDEESQNKNEADVVWKLDMMKELGVSQLYMCTCSVTGAGDKIFVSTSNGVSAEGDVTAPQAPSFLCLDRETGKVIWQDNSPGENILHGQWSSPAYAELAGKPQVLFGAGDGWLYSFDANGENGKSKLLWKFDCNPKSAEYVHGGGGSRYYIIGTPVIHNGLVYVGLGEDPEFGEGTGILWCIDPSKTGDVSPTIVTNPAHPDGNIPNRRYVALNPDEGDVEKENPNSAEVWRYSGSDPSEFETTYHLTIGSPAIKNGLLYTSDFSGVLHCLDAKTGKAHWTYDMFAAAWGSPTIAGEYVYVCDEDGDVAIFELSSENKMLDEPNLEDSVTTSPVVANNRIYIATRGKLIAIGKK